MPFISFSLLSIGYPVVTMSFLIKHHITHIIRQVGVYGRSVGMGMGWGEDADGYVALTGATRQACHAYSVKNAYKFINIFPFPFQSLLIVCVSSSLGLILCL